MTAIFFKIILFDGVWTKKKLNLVKIHQSPCIFNEEVSMLTWTRGEKHKISIFGPYLTFQVCWSQVTTWEWNAFHYSCYLPIYTTYWRSLSSPTALFSSILSILCFWPPFSLIFGPLFDLSGVLEASNYLRIEYISF